MEATTECLFCKISRGEIPSEVLFSDDRITVFKDLNPKAPVHFLIVPKRHIESVQTLTPADGEIIREMILGAKKVATELGLRGYKLVFNVGRTGGQIIDHIHLHLLGGWKGPSSLDI